MRLQRRFFPWLGFHFIEFWYYYLGAFLCLYLLHYFQSQIPQLAKDLGDFVAQGSIEQVNLFQFLWLAMAILIFRTFSRLLFFYPARVQQKYLRHEMMYRLEATHPGLYKHFSDGDIFQTIYNDVNRLRGLVGFGLLQIGNIIIAVWIFYPKIQQFNESFLIAFSPLLLGMVIFTIITYFFQPLMRKDMDMMAVVQNFLIESYDAKKTIKNFHSESSFIELFRHHSYAELRYFFLSGIGKTFGIPLVRLAFGLSLLWAALIVKEQGLSGSSLIFFSGFLFLILEPLMFLSWIGVVLSQGVAAWGRVKDLMNATMQTRDLTWAKRSSALSPTIALWGKDINLHFRPNKWNVIVGDTGVGKSYLLEKMCEVFYAHSYKYSFIHQEPYLYNDTIEANIFLGLEKSAEKKALVKKYCEAFGLTLLASNLDDLLKMEVGENGKKLSGGQQKRVALIRSLVADVDIILWDDPFSSVDFILEKQILDLLQVDENLKSKTFIITSHRISTIKFCDEVVMINKAGVVEEGAVKELFSSDSVIREYFEKQLV